MERKSVSSSNIISVGYKEDEKVLEIEFKGGKVYQYKNVPKDIYDGLISAQSVGKYFIAHIKDKFHCA